MNAEPDHNTRAVVVGLGKSGLSAVRYLRARGARVAVTDSRSAPPGVAQLQALDAALRPSLGAFDSTLLADANLVVVSPGVPVSGEFFARARQAGLPVVGDIELFARAARAPAVGITGTNGKSTVTTLLGRMAARAGRRVRVGGNLGEPALDLLSGDAELYVLELSSYQLETTESLQLAAAAVLNISPDHLDRYGTVAAYAAAKARIFRRCGAAVLNADDPEVMALPSPAAKRLRFSLRADTAAEYRVAPVAGVDSLCCGSEALLPLAAMKLAGPHNAANALAALALGDAIGLPRAAMLAELREFTGLDHRTQWVAERGGVRYIDDSKGTNVGATLAAVTGLPGPLIIIAGGDGKGQDFTPLRTAFSGKVRLVLLIGRDAPALGAALAGIAPVTYCASLEAAVVAAAQAAQPGDTVLLSPACASLDMFRDYAHRGAVFAAAVQGLAA